MADDAFAPLAPASRTTGPASAWTVVMPVPPSAPPPPEQFPRCGTPSHRWRYEDDDGRLLGFVDRFETPAGKSFRPLVWCQRGSSQRWRQQGLPVPCPLYGLRALAADPALPVLVVEGEACVEALRAVLTGWTVITSSGGARAAGKTGWSVLAGRQVTIWPDADEAGRGYASDVARLAQQAGAASVRIVTPPAGVGPGWDSADAVAAGWTREQLDVLITSATSVAAEGAPAAPGRPSRPASDGVLRTLTDGWQLWHDSRRIAYATLTLTDGESRTTRQVWPVRSGTVRSALSMHWYRACDRAIGTQLLDQWLSLLDARALHADRTVEPWRRTGQRDGKVYLDLCDDRWRVVEIDGQGWRVLETHDCPFVRTAHMQALPVPEAGGLIEALWSFIRLASAADQSLLLASLVSFLHPHGPYPALALEGQQGSGKSLACRLIGSLIDPCTVHGRALPRDLRDLAIAGANQHLLVFDNVSHISAEISDGLCRLTSGTGFATRKLHTDSDEVMFTGARPVILNGITTLATRPDLASRTLTLTLEPVPPAERRTEADLLAGWEKARPALLGALLTGVSSALRHRDTVSLPCLPRLADFVALGTAAEPGLGLKPGSVLQAVTENQQAASRDAFESDPVACAIRSLVDGSAAQRWTGTPTSLLEALAPQVDESVRRSRSWPAGAQGLGNWLKRNAPVLAAGGLVVERVHSGERRITIRRASA